MNSWIRESTILLVRAGSNAYGTNTENSDVDLRGVCVPPIEVRNNIFENFTQSESPEFIESHFGHLKNPNNPKLDSTIYDYRKFVRLASECNPNILEILFTPYSEHLVKSEAGSYFYNNRKHFLSTRCAYTFSGYAIAQFKKIERHQKWIKDPPKGPPTREDFQLSPLFESSSKLHVQINGAVKARIEEWNFHSFDLSEDQRKDLREKVFAIIRELTNIRIDWDNWPDIYKISAINDVADQMSLSEELFSLLVRESRWDQENKRWENYCNWKRNRNKSDSAWKTLSDSTVNMPFTLSVFCAPELKF